VILHHAWNNRTLIWQLLRRDIHTRYRGSVLGLLWSLVTPLLMLAIYTFVFQYIFKARWADTAGDTRLGFAMVLFLGLSLHGMLSEVLAKSPLLITSNQNFVKKIVFPLELLSWVNLLSALITFCISFCLLLLFIIIETGELHLTGMLMPLVLLPYFFMLLGISWFLAALGVYLRDIQQVSGTLATLLLFLSPVFYAIDILPAAWQQWIYLNPLSFVVDAARALLIYGQLPKLTTWLIYTCCALVVCKGGHWFFNRVRVGFADVL
jgi:lipopolysaccharide transport system permease protein